MKSPEGVLLIDKSSGGSSFDVVQKVRRALKTKQVGHTGTLDPFASGLLVILVGAYTRLSPYVMSSQKTYEAEIVLGVATNTDDVEGEVIKESVVPSLSEADILAVLQRFLGRQMQIPPIYSAISIKGERAYALARRGEQVEMTPREVEVFSLSLKAYDAPRIKVEVTCSKGTYIRALARDIGAALGVGGHLSVLRRTHNGGFCVEDALPQEQLLGGAVEARLRVGPSALPMLPTLEVDETVARSIRFGQRAFVNTPDDAEAVLLHHKGALLAICRLRSGFAEILRGF